MSIQQTNTDASRYVITRGANQGLSLAEVHAKGAKGLTWLRWAIRRHDPPDFVAAVQAFVREHEPHLLETVASGDDSEAFSSSPPTPRNDGPSSREKHRREVQRRWDARRVVGRFQQRYAESQPLWLTVDDLVVLSEWAAPSQLLGSVDLPPQETARLLDTLVRIIVLKEMPYNDYLQTDEWKGRAAATKERYGGRCALDASHQAEHAHHRTYDRRGRERDADLIPLCADCHAKFHNRRP